MPANDPITTRLRRETEAAHRGVEALPFFAALESGELPIQSYVTLLQALEAVHAALEAELASAGHPLLAAVWIGTPSRLPLLRRDLDQLRPHRTETCAAVLRAQLVAQRIRQRGWEAPVSLLGYLYVLEGSALGGPTIAAQAARALDLRDGAGLAYFSGDGRETGALWAAFTRRMNDALAGEPDRDAVVTAAREAFGGIREIIATLHPAWVLPPLDMVRTLNPDAGSHAIPGDHREREAALRAGERTWRAFPYYAWRYGERGQRFTRSDSAWLVTLAGHQRPVLEQQVLWLGQVLAARGMPRWLLEGHLEVLHEELGAACPERPTQYEGLRAAAGLLRERRRRHLSDDALRAFEADFDARGGEPWCQRLPRTGGLLAAAVADEKDGVVNAVSSVEGWMTDPARFPEQWIRAVRAILAAARRGRAG